MAEARELLGVYVCLECKKKAGDGVPISICWHGHFYGCEHITIENLKESGYFKKE